MQFIARMFRRHSNNAVAIHQVDPAPEAPKSKSRTLIDEYSAALDEKRTEDLPNLANQLARKASPTPKIRKKILSMLSRSGQWSAIRRYAARCDETWQDEPSLLLYAARAERHLHHPTAAIHYLERASSIVPTNEIRRELGLAFVDNKNPKGASAQLILALAHGAPVKFIRPLLKALAEKYPAETVAALSEALSFTPDRPQLLAALGEVHHVAKDGAEAFIKLREALDIDPENPDIGIRLMRAALALPTDEKAMEAAAIGEFFLSRDETNREIAAALTNAYLRFPSIGDAEAGLDRIRALFDNDANLLMSLSAGYLRNGSLAKAETALRRVLELDAAAIRPVYRLAGVLAQQSRTGEAIELLKATIPDENRDALFYARLGHLLTWSGGHLAALEYLRKAVELDPLSSTALGDIALCYDLMQEETTAMSFFKSALVAAAMRPPQLLLGIEEMHPRKMKRRLMQLHHKAGSHSYADALHLEIRRETKMILPYRVTEWGTESFENRRVAALAQSGIGDEIRFTSVYDLHFANAAAVSMTCEPRLHSILTRSYPDFTFYPVQRTFTRLKKDRVEEHKLPIHPSMRPLVSDEFVVDCEYSDVWVRTMDLFEETSFGRSDVAATNTLVARPDLRDAFRSKLRQKCKGRPVIGISWRGGHHSYSRDAHYFKIQQWEPILKMEQFSFVNLQYMLRDDELEYLRNTLGDRFIELPDLDLMDDMESMAALCSELDHLVAICTTILELAGAVGCPILYLMRSPQITHSIRLVGEPDDHGAYADNVWTTCRIIPKFSGEDENVVQQGVGYLRQCISPSQ